jgi:alpha/beta hydrolase fold
MSGSARKKYATTLEPGSYAIRRSRDPKDPAASPLYGNFVGLPPIRVQAGDDEVLLDDSLRFVERAVAAGVDARLDVWEGMPHCFLGSIGQTQAAASALSVIGEFLSSRLAGGFRPHDQSGHARVAGGSEAAQVVGSTLTLVPASSQYTPAERAGLFLKAEREPQ